MSHASGKNPFSTSPSYQEIRHAAAGDLPTMLTMLSEPSAKEAILGDMGEFTNAEGGGATGQAVFQGAQFKNTKGVVLPGWMIQGDMVYPWTDTYEPAQDMMVANIAAANGEDPLALCYDYLLDTAGPHAGVLWRPLFGYSGNNDMIAQGLELPNVIPGFDDAGAHCTILTDATCATSNISYYGRDRTTGQGTLPLELLVKLQTLDAAQIFGLTDRGVLQVGKRADINVMELEKLNVKAPFWANDLPTNAGRWLQYTEGYTCTILRGVVTFENDQHTGALPGRLVRNPLALGVDAVASAAGPARVQDDGGYAAVDLSARAVELSRGGGASAVARVLRDQDKEKPSQSAKL